MAGDPGRTRSICSQSSDSPGGSLGAQAPSLTQRVPTLSLDTNRTPVDLGKWSSVSTELGTRGSGCASLT